MRLPIAHSEGRYVAGGDSSKELSENAQVALRYVGPNGEEDPQYNVNGSTDAIAGLTNSKGNVFGVRQAPWRNFPEP